MNTCRTSPFLYRNTLTLVSRKKSVLYRLEWLGPEEVRFASPGMAWIVGSSIHRAGGGEFFQFRLAVAACQLLNRLGSESCPDSPL